MLVLPKLFEGEFVTKPANAANFNDEQIIDLRWRGLKLLQKRNLFGFTSDSLALAKFVGSHPSYQTVCDLGSGSGGLLLLLWALNPQAQCCGLELLATNVQLAKRSLLLNNHLPELSQHCCFLQGDWRTPWLYFAPQSFDLLVSNPPYWPAGSSRQSPVLERAAARNELFGTLAELISSARWLLKPGGRLAMVLPWQRQQEAEQLLTINDLSLLRLKKQQKLLLIEAEQAID